MLSHDDICHTTAYVQNRVHSSSEYNLKKSLSRALLIRSSNWVSSEDLLYIRCRVRRSTLSWSASHWLVRPRLRSSSRIRFPMCIYILSSVICGRSSLRPYRLLPNPFIYSDDRRQKRRRATSSPVSGRGNYLCGLTKCSLYTRAFAHCLPQSSLLEIFHVSDRSGQ